MDYNFNDLKQVIDDRYGAFLSFNKSCVEYIQSVGNANFEEYIKRVEKRGKQLAFNIIELISHKWRHENFHSDILKFMLDSDKTFLDNFLNIINIDDITKQKYEKSCKIVREEGNIDILIKFENMEKRCIIIENKLNWACDQEQQLCRYYKYALKNKYIIDKIVYITPSPSKLPDEQTFGDKKQEIMQKLEIIYGYGEEGKDLVSCLENIIDTFDNSGKIIDYKVFYSHYLEILKQTGVGDMSIIASKFLEDIKEQSKSDKDVVNKLQYIKEMLNNLPTARINYWKDKFNGSDTYQDSTECYCAKEYGYKDVIFYLDMSFFIGDGHTCDTTIYIGNRHDRSDQIKNKKYRDKLTEIFTEKNLINDFRRNQENTDDLIFYFKKEFKPILEDDKALEVALKYDKILSNLDMEK